MTRTGSASRPTLTLIGGTITAVDDTTDADLTHWAVAAEDGRKVDGSRVPPPVLKDILLRLRTRGRQAAQRVDTCRNLRPGAPFPSLAVYFVDLANLAETFVANLYIVRIHRYPEPRHGH